MDLQHGDQTCVLGAEPDSKTVGDLLRVASELSASTVHSVLWSHPLGFRTVLSPGEAGEDGPAEPDVAKVLQIVRGMAEHVVADLPSGGGALALGVMRQATSVHLVITPDLLSLRRARDMLKFVRATGVETNSFFVVLNQAGGGDITAKEVEAVLGLKRVTRVRADLQIFRAVNRSELSPLACKLLTPLAKQLSRPTGVSPRSNAAGLQGDSNAAGDGLDLASPKGSVESPLVGVLRR